MKRIGRRLLCALLAAMMTAAMLPLMNLAASAAPVTQTNDTTGDIIAFGSYPQTKVTDAALITALESQPLQAGNIVTYNGGKYLKQTDWFKYEPIQWRVLSNTDGELFVMAEKILDSRPYYPQIASVTWENSAIRSWLNGEFYNAAFNASEQAKIKTSPVVNEKYPGYDTDGGNNTNDKLFLLSCAEAANPAYGFGDVAVLDTARVAQGSDYAISRGLALVSGNGYWWLRTPGVYQTRAGIVRFDGRLYYSGFTVNDAATGVRPAMRINLTNYVTGDIVAFGSYPQTKVTDAALLAALESRPLQADNTVTYDGSKYCRVYYTYDDFYRAQNGYSINTVYWFKFEPIEWRVLSNANGELFVMAEKILASRAYNPDTTDVTWETCDLRSWLNGDFYNTAFSPTEQARIKTSAVVTEDNPEYGTDGGNDTNDKLFLLSCGEVKNPNYGFRPSVNIDKARQTMGTDFARSQGLYVNNYNLGIGNSSWWLRSPGSNQHGTSFVYYDGSVCDYNINHTSPNTGIRPAMRINLISDILTPKPGSGCVIDRTKHIIYGLAPGITSLDNFVDVAPGYELEYVPTANGFGTGTVVNALLGGQIVESYAIVIFGDFNGDGNIDNADAGMMVDYENFIVNLDPAANAAQLLAGDINKDGNVDTLDACLVVDAENYLLKIDQATGLAVPI